MAYNLKEIVANKPSRLILCFAIAIKASLEASVILS